MKITESPQERRFVIELGVNEMIAILDSLRKAMNVGPPNVRHALIRNLEIELDRAITGVSVSGNWPVK